MLKNVCTLKSCKNRTISLENVKIGANKNLEKMKLKYSLPQKKVYIFVEPSTQNLGGPDEK